MINIMTIEIAAPIDTPIIIPRVNDESDFEFIIKVSSGVVS
jgi:hypothetical protein